MYPLPVNPVEKPVKSLFIIAVILAALGIFMLYRVFSIPLAEQSNDDESTEKIWDFLKQDIYNDQLSVLTSPSVSEITGHWKLRRVIERDSEEMQNVDLMFELELHEDGKGNYKLWSVPEDDVVGLLWDETMVKLFFFENEEQYYYEFIPKYNKYDDTLVFVIDDTVFKLYRQ